MTRKSGRLGKQAQACRRSAGFFLLLLLIVLSLLTTACSRLPLPSGDSGSVSPAVTESPSPTPTPAPTPTPTLTPTPTPTPMPTPTPTPEPTVRIRIGMVGDMLMHDPVIRGGATGDGSYDYNYMFDYLRPEIAKLDYAIFNMEGTFGGAPYKGFPLFSAPDELAEACAAAGFHCAVTANNHILDRKTAGLQRTLQVLRAAGLDTVGARLTPEESPILIKEVSGIKLAISAYTWETIRQGENSEIPAINGLRMTELDRQLVDSFSEQSKPRDFKADSVREITARAEQMRATGADLVIFIMHWGLEYKTTESSMAQFYTQVLADAGVDLVFAAGPHVINPIRTLTSRDGEHKMLCFYSLGNCISDQYFDTGNSQGHAEDGLLGVVTLLREPGQKVRIESCGYLAFYNYKNKIVRDPSTNRDTPIPVNAALENLAAYEAEGLHNLLRASQTRTRNVMSRNSVKGIPTVEYTVLPTD